MQYTESESAEDIDININIGNTMVREDLPESIPGSHGDTHEAVRQGAFVSH